MLVWYLHSAVLDKLKNLLYKFVLSNVLLACGIGYGSSKFCAFFLCFTKLLSLFFKVSFIVFINVALFSAGYNKMGFTIKTD